MTPDTVFWLPLFAFIGWFGAGRWGAAAGLAFGLFVTQS
jgi:hypothetical protein